MSGRGTNTYRWRTTLALTAIGLAFSRIIQASASGAKVLLAQFHPGRPPISASKQNNPSTRIVISLHNSEVEPLNFNSMNA